MDKMIYTAMSAARQTMDQQSVISHNLANVDTSGFRAQLMNMRAVPVPAEGALPTRTSVVATTPGADVTPGTVQSTGRDLDIALSEGGWLAVQGQDGQEAYTRRGDLRIDGNGVLLSGSRPVLGDGGPIVIPLGSQVFVGGDGTLSIIAEGQQPDALVQVGRMKMVDGSNTQLQRGDDGLFRFVPQQQPGQQGQPGQFGVLPRSEGITLTTGSLEGSNVSAIDGMVAMIANARRYDMQMKVIETADENAQRGNNLLSIR